MTPLTTTGLADIDFAAVRAQMRTAPGFPHFCIDGFLEDGFASEIHDAFPDYLEASRLGRAFAAVNERLKSQVTDLRVFAPPIRRLHELLASDAFVERMSYISGIDGLVADPRLVGGGIHETASGGHLDVHVDFNFNEETGLYRRLNILVYFNRHWPASYGGELDLWDADVKHCLGRFAPLFNRAAGFVTSATSWHGVTPVTCPPGMTRNSFAAYYYTKEPPPGWDGVKRSTVFKARPQEHWKRTVAMPAQALLDATREGLAATRRKVRDVLGG